MSDNDKAMVACSTVGFRSLADGTIRFTVDVDPPNRDVALKAFSEPGTPCILARQTIESAKKEMVANEAKKATAGNCAQAIAYHKRQGKWPSNTADAMCKENNFTEFLISCGYDICDNNYETRNHYLKIHCDGINSKSELDTNHDALTTFMGMLMEYRNFVQDKQNG